MKIILNNTLDALAQDPIGTEAMWKYLGTRYGSPGNFTHTSVSAEGALCQRLKAGTFGMPGGLGNGTGIALSSAPLAEPLREAIIQYDVRFLGSGVWPLGGKLPGLGGVLPGRGTVPTGGHPSPYGWSGRAMFRRRKVDPETATLVGYVYEPTQHPDTVGHDRVTDKVLRWGQWYTVAQHYRMNTLLAEGSPNADGVHRIWVDGVKLYDTSVQVFRLFGEAKINRLVWDIFCGGNDAQWAPAADVDVQVRNLSIQGA